MSSDTTINRTGSADSSDPINNRKNKSDNISISQSSFFNELLNLSKFETKVPPASPTPAASTSAKSSEVKSKDEDEKSKPLPEDGSGDVSKPAADSAAFIAQLASQPVPVLRESEHGTNKSDRPKVVKEKASSQSVDPDSHQAVPGVDSENVIASANVKTDTASLSQSTTDAINIDANLSVGQQEIVPKTSEHETAPIQAPVRSDNADNKHSVKKSAVDNKPKNSTNSPKIPGENSPSNQATTSSVTKADGSKPHVDQSSIATKTKDKTTVDAGDSTPVNRRAERLAERTHGQKTSEDSEQSDDQNSKPKDATNNTTVSTITPISTGNSLSNPDPLASGPSSNDSTPISSVVDTPIASTISNNPVSSGASRDLKSTGQVTGIASAISTFGTPSIPSNAYSFSVPSSGVPSSSESPQPTARTNSGTSISPYQEVKLVQRVLRGLEQLGDGGGQVKLRLHPPELGALQMSLKMEAGKMTAKMEVESTTARDALLNNLQTLKDRLADQGMTVESFDVQISADTSGSGTNGSNLQQNGNPNSNSSWENANSRFAQLNNNRIPPPSSPERTPAQAWTRTNGSLDLTV